MLGQGLGLLLQRFQQLVSAFTKAAELLLGARQRRLHRVAGCPPGLDAHRQALTLVAQSAFVGASGSHGVAQGIPRGGEVVAAGGEFLGLL